MEHRLVRISLWFSTAMLFCLPLLYSSAYIFFASFRYFVFGTVALILLGITGVLWVKHSPLYKTFFRSWYIYGMLGYVAVLVFVSCTGIDPALSFWSSFQRTNGVFATLFAMMFALNIYTVLRLGHTKVLRQLLGASVLGALVLSVLITVCSSIGLGLATTDPWRNAGGAIGNSSLAAAYILWNIASALILAIAATNRASKIWWIGVVGVLGLSPLFVHWQALAGNTITLFDLVGQARGAVLGIVFGALIALGSWMAFKNGVRRTLGIGVLALTLGGSVLFGVKLLDTGSMLHRQFIAVATETRFIFWNIAIEGFKERPFVGWGPGNFGYAYHTYFNPDVLLERNGREVWVDQAHNIIFETLVAGGVVLILALSFFMYTIIKRLLRAQAIGALSGGETAILIGALAGWFFQNLFVFDSLGSIVMLFVVASIAYALSAKQEKILYRTTNITPREKLLIGCITVGAIVVCIFAVYLPAKKAHLIKTIGEATLRERPALWKKLDTISPMGDGIDSTMLFHGVQSSYASQLTNIQNGSEKLKEAALLDLDAAVLHLEKVTTQNNRNYELSLIGARLVYLRMLIADDFSGAHLATAKDFATQAALLSPTDPQPLWVAAQIVIGEGQYGQGKVLLERALVLQPQLENTHRMILQLARIQKDTAYYQSAFLRAKEVLPGFVK